MRILAIDVETKFITAAVWSLWEPHIAINQIFDAGGMICYAARYVGEKTMHFRRLGDKDFLTHLHKLIEDADSLLTFNGKRFDAKKINTAFLLAGMKPPAPCRHIDLYQTVKQNFSLPSNKLQYISGVLGIGQKTDHEGFPLWIKCADGDEKAWKKMMTYNKRDVVLLENLYDKLKGWVKQHPSHSIEQEAAVCTNCGGKKLQARGWALTAAGRYQRYQCQSAGCGKWMRGKTNEVHPDNRKSTLVGI
jgi:uncharacterized protein